ncbi:MAG TPA: SRPBCC domain-containing protein [Microlunatus sp.]
MTDVRQTQHVAEVADAAGRGELIREGERPGLRYVRHYPHPIERVWRAITESDQLRHWMPCDIVGDRSAGAAISLPFWPGHVEKYAIDEPTLTGRIEIWEPPSRFGWTWGGDVLIFELIAIGGETQLVFSTWPEDPDLAGLVNAAGGYHLCLAELTLLLDDGSAPPMTEVDEVAFRLTESYRQQFGQS